MSSLLKVTVMKVNTYHVNFRFTLAPGWHKNKNRLTLAFYSKKHVNFVSYCPFYKIYFLPWHNPHIDLNKIR